METDVEEEVMAIDDVQGKDEGVLHLPEEWQNVDVERTHHSGDAEQDQHKTQLCAGKRRVLV